MRGIRIAGPTGADRLFIAGMTGKGKSTLVRYLAEGLQPVRVIVFDPKGLGRWGAAPARTPAELERAMNAPVVHYIPASFDRKELEAACELVWQTPGPYLWIVDDVNELTNPNYCPPGLRLANTQGREHRKMVATLTQRLAETHPCLRSQADHVIIFTPPPIELDLRTIAGTVRREAPELERELAELHAEHGDYSHLWYVRDTDELRRCAPLELAGVNAPAPTSETPSASPHPDAPTTADEPAAQESPA